LGAGQITEMKFSVTFWGVRGSVPIASPDYTQFGGNTPCVEVRIRERIFVLDAGTGIVPLGQKLKEEGVKDITLLFSHLHHDHTAGLPFFAPIHDKSVSLTMYCGNLGGESAQKHLDQVFGPPFFPIVFSRFQARMKHEGFVAGEALGFGDVSVSTQPLNHPGGSTGYRFDCGGKSVSYITDVEHVEDLPDPDVRRFVNRSDLLIYDTMLTEDEVPTCRGWGHSTWKAGVKLAQSARVGQLAAFHHNPQFNDGRLTRLDAKMKTRMADAFFAREGTTIAI
jgi:phosphoribosyl 1,2-cyclic phosphodiesterase